MLKVWLWHCRCLLYIWFLLWLRSSRPYVSVPLNKQKGPGQKNNPHHLKERFISLNVCLVNVLITSDDGKHSHEHMIFEEQCFCPSSFRCDRFHGQCYTLLRFRYNAQIRKVSAIVLCIKGWSVSAIAFFFLYMYM